LGQKGGGADKRRVPRGRCGAYIGAEQTALACGPRAGRRGGAQPDSARVRARPELGDDPDMQAPPVGGLRERRPKWVGPGRKKVNGPA